MGKKRKLEQLHNTPKKFFAVNGLVNEEQHFFVDPSDWNLKRLLPKVEHIEFFILLAPSQTGKTTRASIFMRQLQKQGFFPLLYTLLFYFI